MTENNHESHTSGTRVQSSPAVQVYELLMGWTVSSAVQEVVRLEVPDVLLPDQSRSVQSLAQQLGVYEATLLLLLRAVSSVGIFAETALGIFTHTERSRVLRSDAPDSMAGMAKMLGSHWNWAVWQGLDHAVRTGICVFDDIFRQDFWSYMQSHTREATIFNEAMTSFSQSLNEAVVAAYDFSHVNILVDVGGGQGSLLATLLQKYPDLHGMLLDLPSVIESTQVFLTGAGVAAQCTCVAGSFFERVPPKANVYLLKQVLHDWSDEQCVQILQNCAQAMRAGGRVLVVEYVLPEPPTTPSPYLFVGLWMKLNTPGGYERTEAQFHALFEQAGLQVLHVHPTTSTHSILEAGRSA